MRDEHLEKNNRKKNQVWNIVGLRARRHKHEQIIG